MRKSGRQNIFIRRKPNEADANNKPTKAVIYRKIMQISEICFFFFYQLSFDIIHKTHADYVTSDVCSYTAVKKNLHTLQVQLQLFLPSEDPDWSWDTLFGGGGNTLIWELSNLDMHATI